MEIGLVLGGGGARGLAHIGACRALLERGYRPSAIAGCSMGAIIGALIASGKTPDDIEEMARSLRRRDLMELGDHGAVLGNERIGDYLADHLPEEFEELEIPLKVTTVDCQKGTLVVLGSGPLIPALLASSAMPGLLTPIFLDDHVFVDGGVLNNLPVDVIRAMTTAPAVAIDIAVPPDRKLNFQDHTNLLDRISSVFDKSQRWLTIELFLKSFDIPLGLVTSTILAFHPPDLLIRPDLDADFKREDFDRVDEAIEAGYDGAKRALEGAGWNKHSTR